MSTTGFQFVHLEVFGRKSDAKGRSVDWVLSEAAREPAACPHVANPEPPEIVHGVSLAEVRRLHDDACSSAKTTLANGRTRAISRDQKTLLTIVASHPATMDSVRANPTVAADVGAWEERTVQWLRDQYGEGLLSVVRHVDESYAHLHAYVLPSDLKAAGLHPGTAAKRAITSSGPAEGEDSKSLNRRGDAAYRAAMREWQDSYHRQVSIACGLARLGPRRRRLTREAWQAEKAAATAAKAAIDRAARVNSRGREFVAAAKATAAASISAAQEQIANAQALQAVAEAREKRASTLLDRAGHQELAAKALHAAAEAKERKASIVLDRAEQIVAQATSRASRIISWGGRIRSFFDGLRQSSIVEAARRAVASDLAREREAANESHRRALEEAARRQEAERRARAAAESARASARERDQARRELAVFRPAALAAEVGRRMGR